MNEAVDVKVTLNDEKEYVVERLQAIYFFDGKVNVIGEYTYEFGCDELFSITVINEEN